MFLDGAFFCRLPERGAAAVLEVGQELAPARLEALRDEAQREEAVERALRYLGHRPRSRFELERHLRSRGYVEPAVRESVRRCSELGYLDDREFAAAFARDRIRLRPRSVSLLEAELRRRGVSLSDARAGISAALRDEGVTEEELLRRAAEKAWRTMPRGEPERARRRLHAYLTRRGFDASAARAVVDEMTERGSPRPAPGSPGGMEETSGGPGGRPRRDELN